MKKNKFFAIICILLCLIMTCSFYACGEPNEGNDDIKPTGELQKDDNGNVIFKNVSIKLETVVAGDDKESFNQIIQRFNRAYDGKIIVNVTNTPASSYENTVASKINNNNNAPDLIMSHQKSHKNFADNKLIQPLDNIVKESGITINASDYADGLAQYMTLGTDKLYSVPVDAQSHVVFYNKKLLNALGMDVPTNRTELLAVCKAFKEKYNKVPIAWMTDGDYFGEYVFTTAVLQNGGSLYDAETLKATWFDDKTNLNAIHNASESIRELFSKGYANYNEASSNTLTSFLNGQRLFYFTDPWSMEDLVSNFAQKEGVTEAVLMEETLGGASIAGWFAMSDTASKNYVYGDSHFFAMSKTVTDINKQAAILEFIKWYTTNATMGAKWAQAGHISASKTITAAKEYQEDPYVVNYVGKFYGSIDNFRCIGNTSYYEAIITGMKGIFADTVNTGTHTLDSDKDSIKKRQSAANSSISFFG